MRGGWDRDERETPSDTRLDSAPARIQAPARRPRPPTHHHRPPLDLPRGIDREPVYTPRVIYRLRGREVDALTVIGTFRSVAVSDLQRIIFKGDRAACTRELANVESQGLMDRRTAIRDRRSFTVVALTRAGRALMNASRPRGTDDAPQQRFYSGFVKPRELAHDTALYPMAERERSALEARGARVTRVVLDAELLQTVLHAWQNACRDRDPDEAKRAVAEAYGLPVVGGRLQFPDVRLEYEHANGERDRVDLELVTRQYRRGDLNLKAQAGFRLYTARDAEVIDGILAP